MMNERNIGPLYVIGHKNPDTDSICSAIGNASFLRRHGYPDAVAARCGEVTQRTAWVLEQAQLPQPVLIRDATPTAESICHRNIISVLPGDTFLTTYKRMTENNLSSIPVIDEQGKLHGLIRYLDLLNLLLPKQLSDDSVRSVVASLDNIAKTINARCLTGETLSTEDEELFLLVGASSEPSVRSRLANYKRKGLIHKLCVICGDRPNVQLFAVENGVRALVITADAHPTADIREEAQDSGTCILSTPWDTASVGQLIRCSRRVHDVVHRDFVTFTSGLPLSQMRQLAVQSRQPLFPVLDKISNKVVGVVSKTDLVDPPRMRLALVDHNEFSQAVDGVEEAEIVEVMDHHRLGSQVSTRDPIRFLNEPVGSTSTLVARRFFHRDEEPEPNVALCLCAGILSDTINLTSPTTTSVDRLMMEWLMPISGIDPQKFTEEFFSTGSLLRSRDSSAVDIIQADRKEFVEFGFRISISQVEEVGVYGFDAVRHQLQKALEELQVKEKYRLACLLVTDISTHDSLLLAVGDPDVLDNLEFKRLDDNLFSAKGVVSRKKQLFPAISQALKGVE
ncbi:putative manganese-dependent inorganic diphosphatase [Akkermansia sp. N21116]|uniref:putative manganese-dependent inorganic diphosphatase n=1 Tax=Akkermansia sp. N21116 TaxID=3040764 RepID=UPI00244EC575|nr:putative manganese-dependent inorganic diphosphatase [Akkermansia sp. N21116]WPX41110.1 putative manganese-dependent inorganic diphosphatase [Akkermansia sp. N21116]